MVLDYKKGHLFTFQTNSMFTFEQHLWCVRQPVSPQTSVTSVNMMTNRLTITLVTILSVHLLHLCGTTYHHLHTLFVNFLPWRVVGGNR